MTTDVVTVDKDAVIETALDLMRKHNLSKLPVVERRRLVGLLYDGDIVDLLGAFRTRGIPPTTLHVSSAMHRDFPRLGPDAGLREILSIATRDGVGLLPVTNGDDGILGVVTKADLLPLVKSDAAVSTVMVRQLHSVGPDDRIIHARRIMIDHGIERLPVLDRGALVGILGELDIALALDDWKRHTPLAHQANKLKELLVRDFMRPTVVTGTPEMSIAKAAKRLRDEDVGGLPIIEAASGRIQGMVTRTDLLRTVRV
ncbi:MAG: CBS domain-containing protein [Methanobacteriota archaeon]